jgi:hypothetical protein
MFDPKNYTDTPAGGGGAKVLAPGTHYCHIVDIYLETPSFDKEARELIVMLEGVDEGEGFQGLQVSRQDPNTFFRGKVARVKATRWSFKEFVTKKGETVERDPQIYRWISHLATQLGVMPQIMAKGEACQTIDEYVDMVARYVLRADKWGFFTVAGEEYEKNNGYTDYRLFFPKGAAGKSPFSASETAQGQPADLLAFSEREHLIPKKDKAAASSSPAAEPVGGFDDKGDLLPF